MSDSQDNVDQRGSRNRRYSPSAHVVVHDKSGLYVAVIAAVVGALALGALMMMPQIIEARVQAGMAEARASMQQQAEEAKAIADAGATDGRLALDRVEKAVAKLEAKGLIRESH